jgi:hypothetical protein
MSPDDLDAAADRVADRVADRLDRSATPAQPRDEAGRFAARSGSFDGGARQPVPARKSPEQAHGELVAQLVTVARTFGTGTPSP